MSEDADYILDIGHLADRGADNAGAAPRCSAAGSASASGGGGGQPWLSVHWKCCGAYSRIYRNRQGTAYVGHCPRCGKPVRAQIGPGGTAARFFEAY